MLTFQRCAQATSHPVVLIGATKTPATVGHRQWNPRLSCHRDPKTFASSWLVQFLKNGLNYHTIEEPVAIILNGSCVHPNCNALLEPKELIILYKMYLYKPAMATSATDVLVHVTIAVVLANLKE